VAVAGRVVRGDVVSVGRRVVVARQRSLGQRGVADGALELQKRCGLRPGRPGCDTRYHRPPRGPVTNPV
jgi:hypothetical protein